MTAPDLFSQDVMPAAPDKPFAAPARGYGFNVTEETLPECGPISSRRRIGEGQHVFAGSVLQDALDRAAWGLAPEDLPLGATLETWARLTDAELALLVATKRDLFVVAESWFAGSGATRQRVGGWPQTEFTTRAELDALVEMKAAYVAHRPVWEVAA